MIKITADYNFFATHGKCTSHQGKKHCTAKRKQLRIWNCVTKWGKSVSLQLGDIKTQCFERRGLRQRFKKRNSSQIGLGSEEFKVDIKSHLNSDLIVNMLICRVRTINPHKMKVVFNVTNIIQRQTKLFFSVQCRHLARQ